MNEKYERAASKSLVWRDLIARLGHDGNHVNTNHDKGPIVFRKHRVEGISGIAGRLVSCSIVSWVLLLGFSLSALILAMLGIIYGVNSILAGLVIAGSLANLWNTIKLRRIVHVLTLSHEYKADRVGKSNLSMSEPIARDRDLSGSKRDQLGGIDPLTGLRNRDQLAQLLQTKLRDTARYGGPIALLVFDVKRLRDVNGYYGYRVGDGVLQQLARRLSAVAQAGSHAFRIGNDNFALILDEADDRDQIERFARLAQLAVSRPLHINGCDISPQISVGIAMAPHHARNFEQLLHSAELALDLAKKSENADVKIFEKDMDAVLRSRRSIERELKRAMSERLLTLHYQPQFDLRSGAVCGVEALMRWPHPTWGMVPPMTFIAVAESTGLIRSMGVWLIRQACQQIVAWRDAGHDLSMAVNISAAQLRQPEMAQIVRDALAATGCEPGRLELEVTESLFVDPSETKMRLCLNRLAEMGVRLAIDDFGTGYSSLSYLKRLPVDKIKIDKSFLIDVGKNSVDEELVRAIIGLAKTLGKDVLAEGVEESAQRQFLVREGCDQAQGFYFAKPMPEQNCTIFLNNRRSLESEPICA